MTKTILLSEEKDRFILYLNTGHSMSIKAVQKLKVLLPELVTHSDQDIATALICRGQARIRLRQEYEPTGNPSVSLVYSYFAKPVNVSLFDNSIISKDVAEQAQTFLDAVDYADLASNGYAQSKLIKLFSEQFPKMSTKKTVLKSFLQLYLLLSFTDYSLEKIQSILKMKENDFARLTEKYKIEFISIWTMFYPKYYSDFCQMLARW